VTFKYVALFVFSRDAGTHCILLQSVVNVSSN